MASLPAKKEKRKPLETLSLRGDTLEIAHQLGHRRSSKIPERIDFWDRHLSGIYKGKKALLKKLERTFLKEAKRQTPAYLEEVAAMAEGARVKFCDLFRLNLTELSTFVDKCTDLIFAVKTPHGKRILICHNEDWDPERNDVFLLKAKLPGLTYLTFAYDGYLPGLSAGMNSHGLCHSVNYLRPLDHRLGLPRIFVTRHLLTATGIDDCLRFIEKRKRAFGQAVHLAEGSRYLGLELTARKLILRSPPLPTVHTNHYLAESLKKTAPKPVLNSVIRLKTSQRLLRKKIIRGKSITVSEAKKIARRILSDRSTAPHGIWRALDLPRELSSTLATALVGTHSSVMEVFRDRPIENAPILCSLKE
ncbi:MAG: C45 family peptidase [bacterium]